MTSLITRLRELKGPDREVDARIWLVVMKNGESMLMAQRESPHYTGSLDAALTLVPEGYFWWLGHLDETDRRFVATVSKRAVVDYPAERAICDTAAIALCIAALQARGVK